MTTQTWTEQVEDRFTEADFNTFNDMFDLRAISSQSEQLVLTKEVIDFEDSQPNGPVEDIHLYHKTFNRDAGVTILNQLASFLNVSDHEEICMDLFSLAKKHHFDVEKMMEDIQDNPDKVSCNEVLINN